MTDLLTPVAFASRQAQRRRLSLMADFLILAMPILVVILLVLLYADPALGRALIWPAGAVPVAEALAVSPVTRWALIIASAYALGSGTTWVIVMSHQPPAAPDSVPAPHPARAARRAGAPVAGAVVSPVAGAVAAPVADYRFPGMRTVERPDA